MPPKTQPQQFKEGDLVWALDSGRYYQARILAAEKSTDKWSYFVHFMNWNKKWDRWFEAAGLKALDDEEVHAAVGGDVQKKRIMGVAAAGSAEEAAAAQSVREEEQNRKRRRKALAAKELCEEEEAANSKLPIPFTLKKLLVDEWETVTKPPIRLAKLPRQHCVREVLYDFLDSKRRRADSAQLAKYQDLLEGLSLYFDKALPMILLYRQERSQYGAVAQQWPDASPSLVYGVEHLLRLFVKIPRLMTQVALAPAELSHVQSKFTELLKFLQKNHSTYFVGEYVAEEDATTLEFDMAARIAALQARQQGIELAAAADNGDISSTGGTGAPETEQPEAGKDSVSDPPSEGAGQRNSRGRGSNKRRSRS